MARRRQRSSLHPDHDLRDFPLSAQEPRRRADARTARASRRYRRRRDGAGRQAPPLALPARLGPRGPRRCTLAAQPPSTRRRRSCRAIQETHLDQSLRPAPNLARQPTPNPRRGRLRRLRLARRHRRRRHHRTPPRPQYEACRRSQSEIVAERPRDRLGCNSLFSAAERRISGTRLDCGRMPGASRAIFASGAAK